MNVVIRLAALFVALGADGATAQQATPDALDLAAPAAHRTTTLYLAIGHDDFRADDGGDGRTELQARFVRFGADFDLTETVGAPFYVGLSIDRRRVESEVQLTGFPVEIEGDPVPGCTALWPLRARDGSPAGQVSSAAWSPDFSTNVAIAMVASDYWDEGTELKVDTPDGERDVRVRSKYWI